MSNSVSLNQPYIIILYGTETILEWVLPCSYGI